MNERKESGRRIPRHRTSSIYCPRDPFTTTQWGDSGTPHLPPPHQTPAEPPGPGHLPSTGRPYQRIKSEMPSKTLGFFSFLRTNYTISLRTCPQKRGGVNFFSPWLLSPRGVCPCRLRASAWSQSLHAAVPRAPTAGIFPLPSRSNLTLSPPHPSVLRTVPGTQHVLSECPLARACLPSIKLGVSVLHLWKVQKKWGGESP